MELNDKDYIERCLEGNAEDFAPLVSRYQGALFGYLNSRLENESEAEEAAQESFIRAFFSLKNLRKPESFYFWLLGIAARVAKETFRSHARREQSRKVVQGMTTEVTNDKESEYPLEEAIAVLPESYRHVILLRYYDGLSCQEVADRLEVPLGTVTKRLSRAYALLRQELKRRESEASVNNKEMNHELR